MSNMTGMSNEKKNIIERIQKKIKSSNLKPEEIQAIDKARSQVYNQTTVGGFIGAIGTFFLGRKRRISPFFMIPFVGGGFLIGSQVGMVSGIMSGMKTINKLPDQARLVNLVKDIQIEVMNANGYTQDDPKSRPRPMTPEEKERYQQKLLNQKDHEEQPLMVNNNSSDKNDDPWWTDNDYNTAKETPIQVDSYNEKLWKDDGDTFLQDNNNDNNGAKDMTPPSSSSGSNSTWDRIREGNK